MPPIRVLPDRVANQIAAGEVIERPVAVVKELVENSLDAGATRIEITFARGGKHLIRIEDDGCGMTPDEALLSLERFATSKLSETDDLLALRSFGFRGEALPSIASVSRFSLRTRTAGARTGCEIRVNAGKLTDRREIAANPGTRIEVAQLFGPVPARRKFLKTDATEAAHIIHLARLYAVAHPEVAFTLIEDGRVVFRSPVCRDLTERVTEIWGRRLARDLMPLSVDMPGGRLHGLIGRPGVGRATRQEMHSFVNRRPVSSRTLDYALIEAYHTRIPKGRYPLAFLFVDIDAQAVDVNVHPAKREVRFRDEARVRNAVLTAVLDALRQAQPGETESRTETGQRPEPDGRFQPVDPLPKIVRPSPRPDSGPSDEARSPQGGSPAPPDGPLPSPEAASADRKSAPPPAADRSITAPTEPAPRGLEWRFVGQVHGDYAAFETRTGLVLLRIASARARIRFETVLAAFEADAPGSQPLLVPATLDLPPLAAATLEEHRAWLNEHGFAIEEFGRNFYRIQAVPAWLSPEEAEAFLRDLIDLMAERGSTFRGGKSRLAEETLARWAAERGPGRGAGAADHPEALRDLARRLMACRDPLTDPSGRPTVVELSRGELERRFGLR
ncbi:MAG: DNA mismatch repair endonuclease MutL [Opitutales bacterium]